MHISDRDVSRSKREYVFNRDRGQCQHCGARLSGKWFCDHIMELQYGGSNDVNNLQALCPACHGRKTGTHTKGASDWGLF